MRVRTGLMHQKTNVKWQKVLLHEVAEIERNVVEPSAIISGTKFVGLENIETGGEFANVRHVLNGELASSKFAFTDKHVLYGKLRPYLAKIARPTFSGICSTDILPILPGANLDRDYLSQFLRQPSMIDLANSRATGANLPRLSPKVLAEFSIPLPPIAEQKRIAAILDKAEELRSLRRKALAELDAIVQSIFLEMFGDPVRNPKGWECKSIKQIGRAVTGNTPSRSQPELYGDAIEWIKSDNINTPHSYLTKASEGLSQLGKEISRIVPKCSILVTCIAGSPDCIGNAAIADREVAFNQQINALVPELGDFRFLYAQILVNKCLVQEASTSSMKGMVNKSRFEEIQLIFPKIELQENFGKAFDKIESLKATQRESLDQLDALFSSLQHRAFQGEL